MNRVNQDGCGVIFDHEIMTLAKTTSDKVLRYVQVALALQTATRELPCIYKPAMRFRDSKQLLKTVSADRMGQAIMEYLHLLTTGALAHTETFLAEEDGLIGPDAKKQATTPET